MKIKLDKKNHFGNELLYPACDASRIFAHMLQQKSLTRENVESIAKLGFDVEINHGGREIISKHNDADEAC